MKYYNGFSLKDEEYLFEDYITDTNYTICGFSYGAIKAFKKVQKELQLGNRVDKLILLSPAFFQTKSTKFKKLQLIGYKKHKINYLNQFLESCFLPHKKIKVKTKDTKIEELEELLNYQWIIDDLKFLEEKGVKIEVYLGGEDKIIDIVGARELFLEMGTLTYMKNANHFLQID